MSTQIRYKKKPVVTFEKGTITLKTEDFGFEGDLDITSDGNEADLTEINALIGIKHNEKYNWKSIVVKGTCINGGYTYDKCDCGDIRVETEAVTASGRPTTDADGHYDLTDKDSSNHAKVVRTTSGSGTCNVGGICINYCSSCDSAWTAPFNPNELHDAVSDSKVSAIAPTDTTEGSYEHFVCKDCGKKIYIDDNGNHVIYEEDSEIIIPALGNPDSGCYVEESNITEDTIKAKLQSLIDESNNKTGNSDKFLIKAVNSLVDGYGDSPLPIKVESEAEMNALLDTAAVGSIYKYVDKTTDTYESGALYVVEAVT